MKLNETPEVMAIQKIRSAARLIQSIDWNRVGMTRILHDNGRPQYTTSTPRCAMGVWTNPDIAVIIMPTSIDARMLNKIVALKFLIVIDDSFH